MDTINNKHYYIGVIEWNDGETTVNYFDSIEAWKEAYRDCTACTFITLYEVYGNKIVNRDGIKLEF